MTKPAFIQQPLFADGESLRWHEPFPGERIALRIDGRDTDGRYGVAEGIIEPMVGPPLHIHHDADEIIYVVEGIVDFAVAGRRLRSGKGGIVLIPRGTPHAFRNFSAEPARLLGFFAPAGLERMFPAMEGRPLEDFPQVAAEFSVEIVGPPLEPAA